MDECAGFENRCPERDRGFESLTLRHAFSTARSPRGSGKEFPRAVGVTANEVSAIGGTPLGRRLEADDGIAGFESLTLRQSF